MKNEEQILAAHYTWRDLTDHTYLLIYLEIIKCKYKDPIISNRSCVEK